MTRGRRRPGNYRPGRRSRVGGVGVWIAVALVVAGCAPQPAPATKAASPAPTAVLIDADSDGAILLDQRGHYIGVARDGAIVWRDPAGVRAYTLVSCLARCPDAALSASLEARNTATVADPVPRLVIGGQWRLLDTVAGHKRRILTAASAEDFVLAGGESGRAWLELHRPGDPVQQLPVGGFDSTVYRSADGRQALVMTAVAGGNETRWLIRTDRGWQQVGSTQRATGVAACVAPDGSRALLLGQRPAVLDRDGNQRPMADLESAGTCAWAGSGGIVAELATTGAGPRSRLRVFDAGGAVRWRLDTAGVAAVTADPTGTRVAYLLNRTLHEIDPVQGVELRTIAGIQAARYDLSGDLVTITGDGAVVWRH